MRSARSVFVTWWFSLTPRLTLAVAWGVLSGAGLATADDALGQPPVTGPQPTDASVSDPLVSDFTTLIAPFLERHCFDCHGAELREAKLDLRGYMTPESMEVYHQTWEEVLHRIEAGEMPPRDAEQPAKDERDRATQAIRQVRIAIALRKAGDPGPIVTRRLSHAEYNYTLRDLTGQDLQPTKDFPIDPANEAGFDNTGESLTMSPSLLEKYLSAARFVAEHLVLKPHGFAFAPHPVVTETDRDKYCVRRIVDFYQRQPTDLADYFLAAWRFRCLDEGLQNEATLQTIATQARISPRYLAEVCQLLREPAPGAGPLALIHRLWRELPSDPSQAELARSGCDAIGERIATLRGRMEPSFSNLELKGGHLGSQQFVLWKNDQYAAHRRRFVPETIAAIAPGSAEAAQFPELLAPEDPGGKSEFDQSLTRFCDLFPDPFYVSERGRDYVGKKREEQEKGRLLSAGFHSMMGYYRDDAPLYDLILDDAGRGEIDQLWQELDFITSAPTRQYSGFVWFERTDSAYLRDEVFDFARAEDKSVTSEAMIRRLSEQYRAKAVRNGGSDQVLAAIDTYFDQMNRHIRWVEQARLAAEPSHLEALVEFAARAYRRPLGEDEMGELLGFYRALRDSDGLSHEEAMQDSVVSILISPWFSYRVDLAPTTDQRRPLTDIELASRLSYFLWSSMPDDELLRVAQSGQLREPNILTSQAQRMLASPRSEALAFEFAGNWLDFRRFEQHNSVDRNRFPQFTDSLRQAMFQEPIRFFVDLVRRDGSVLEFLDARHTFVNAELAAHYGIADVDYSSGPWQRVDAANFHRGGLLPMAVFQTANAPGLRTSPVKRGYWVARRLLGERIPAPPPDVPELPADEQDFGERTLAETLAKHREHSSCAGCHDRFDSLGLALENFDPIGQWRIADLSGHAVDSRAEFPGGHVGDGVEGLRQYLTEHRRQHFVDHLSRKLLSYALGRNLILSDEPLVESLQADLVRDGFRFNSLVNSIITSPQFLEKRGRQQP